MEDRNVSDKNPVNVSGAAKKLPYTDPVDDPFGHGDAPTVKLLDRTPVYHGSILEVYDDLVEVKGRKAHWDFIHHNGAAAVLPVADDGRILMVRQYRSALRRFTLEIPAGKLDSPDEPMLDCAKRELEEETGYVSDDLERLITVTTYIAFCDEKIGIYVARNLRKTAQHLDEDEDIEVIACTLQELQELIYAGKITDSKTISAIMAYACKTKNC